MSRRFNFNPRSPCGERHVAPFEGDVEEVQFQSTLPVWGATTLTTHNRATGQFQSTLPVWGATNDAEVGGAVEGRISIHAPRVGSDMRTETSSTNTPYFNPRSPCGERLRAPILRRLSSYFNPRSPCGERRPRPSTPSLPRSFQSTLPVWGATVLVNVYPDFGRISIHAPRVGSDVVLRFRRSVLDGFQSTLPVWGATYSRATA